MFPQQLQMTALAPPLLAQPLCPAGLITPVQRWRSRHQQQAGTGGMQAQAQVLVLAGAQLLVEPPYPFEPVSRQTQVGTGQPVTQTCSTGTLITQLPAPGEPGGFRRRGAFQGKDISPVLLKDVAPEDEPVRRHFHVSIQKGQPLTLRRPRPEVAQGPYPQAGTIQHPGTGLPGQLRAGISGAVVHHQQLAGNTSMLGGGAYARQGTGDMPLFIE